MSALVFPSRSDSFSDQFDVNPLASTSSTAPSAAAAGPSRQQQQLDAPLQLAAPLSSVVEAAADSASSEAGLSVISTVPKDSEGAGGKLAAVGVKESKAEGKARSQPPSSPAGFSSKTLVCPTCSKAFSKKAKLREHNLVHSDERPHMCPHCELSFVRLTHLQAHVRTHLPESAKPFVCSKDGCDKRFWTPQHVRRHEEGCGEGRYQCPLCSESFALNHLLRSHHALDHSPPGTKPFPCSHPNCDKSFATSQKLRQHSKIHDETRYQCHDLSHASTSDPHPTFATWSLLRAHVASAHPPRCPHTECMSRPPFKSNKNLKAHLKTHAEREMDDALFGPEESDGEPPHRGRKRSREEDGEREGKQVAASPRKRRRSVSLSGKDFLCEEEGCGKAFKSRKTLRTHHQTTHLNLRPHACPHCPKTYGHKHLLQRHLGKNHLSAAAALAAAQTADDLEAARIRQEITGATTLANESSKSKRTIRCPFSNQGGLISTDERLAGYGLPSAAREQVEETAPVVNKCGFVCSRAYDLRRHLAKEHGFDVGEEEARGLADRLSSK